MPLSDNFAGAPTTQVAAVTWGNHFALYATSNVGHVMCSGVYLQSGLMGPWKPFTNGFSGVAGAPVAAAPWGRRHALFAVDSKGQAMCAGGEPETGLIGPWKPITEGFETKPDAPITALPWGSRFALFATNTAGQPCCAGADPQHGLMGPWKVIDKAFAGVAGAPVTAVKWGNRFALFAIDADGVVQCAGGDPQHGLVNRWEPISDDFVGIPGGSICAQPWGNHYALFATNDQGQVCLAGDYLETGLMGPWTVMSDGFAGTPGTRLTVAPWAEVFALVAVDSAGVVRAASGNPEINLTSWAPLPNLASDPGTPATLVTAATGLGVFTTDITGAVSGAAGGAQVFTGFWPDQHGWHFDNTFVTEVAGIDLNGLCGGMAYSSLDYYFNGIPIPTHVEGDFPGPGYYPPSGRLHSMIFNRLIDSFGDNFGKWACIYTDLYALIGTAIGVVASGGGLAGLFGGLNGWFYGEVHNAFECPGGGPSGMTKKELPRLVGDFLDNGKPVPIGLVYDGHIGNIGKSHQVVAYGYVVAGPQTFIYVYDNRVHDTVCALGVDTEDPQKIIQYLGDLTTTLEIATGNDGTWEALLVEDGYKSQKPTYGPDITISVPPMLTMTGPIINAPITPDPTIMAKIWGGTPPATLVFAPQPTQTPGAQLTDSYTVQNMGEWQAHYQSLGIEIDGPAGAVTIDPPTPYNPGPDNILAPGQTQTVQIVVANFGEVVGTYAVKAGYNSTPAAPDAGPAVNSRWLPLAWPPTLVPVA
jgi:hypothetical protein